MLQFDEIYSSHQRQIVSVCYRILRNREDAEDAAQETFLHAHQALPKFQERGVPVGAWLLNIARHTAISQFRKRPAVEIISIDATLKTNEYGNVSDHYTLADLIPAPDLSPETRMFFQEVMEMVECLCPTQRTPMLLMLQGYRIDEIGACMGMLSAMSITMRLFHARQKLKALTGKRRVR